LLVEEAKPMLHAMEAVALFHEPNDVGAGSAALVEHGIAYVRYALAEAAETDGEVAYDIFETVIIRVIVALRADPGLPARSRAHWELALADAIGFAAHGLRRLNGLVSRQQAIWAIEDFFINRSCDTSGEPSAPQASPGA
jgi:hypothetical protein